MSRAVRGAADPAAASVRPAPADVVGNNGRTVYTAVYALGAAVVSWRVVVTRPVWRVKDVAWLLTGMYMSAVVQGTTSVLMRAWRPGWTGNGFWQDMSRFAAGDGTGMLRVVPLALFVIRPMMRRTEKLNTDEHVYVGSPDAPIAPNRKVQRRSEHLAQGLSVLATIAVAVVTIGRGAEFSGGGLLLLILPLAWLSLREGLRGSTLIATQAMPMSQGVQPSMPVRGMMSGPTEKVMANTLV